MGRSLVGPGAVSPTSGGIERSHFYDWPPSVAVIGISRSKRSNDAKRMTGLSGEQLAGDESIRFGPKR